MKLNDITTLENLREYLRDKHENEWNNLSVEEKLKKQAGILSEFELSVEEYEYAAPLTVANESQSAKKTIVNASKALEILVKRSSK